jgi:hypothetical protein
LYRPIPPWLPGQKSSKKVRFEQLISCTFWSPNLTRVTTKKDFFNSHARRSPAMLSEKAVALLAALPYRPDAEWGVNILPFGSIYWKDEMPSLRDLVEKQDDMLIIHAMFGIRLKLWDREVLNAQDQRSWDAVKGQVPHWVLFHRLNLNEEQEQAREEAERQVEREFESLSDNCDNAPV